ncbi:MAG: Stp1/IreP family PP2C-type Ser/Thr phosphatase [Actinobacteria bacterium]|nr:Stp1/IreP family PP2C-type Ser/Thr phosphatase [Actinomycetota bacterium]
MEYYAATDIGNYRDINEDYYFCGNDLFVVADGMGGQNAGEVASRYAVENFIDYFQKNSEKLTDKNNLSQSDIIIPESEKIKQILRAGISSANEKVYNLSLKKPEYSGMGTTFTACYINGLTAYVVHVGDSRIYVKTGKKLNLLTSDHTVVGEMYRSGLLKYEEIFNHPQRNYLTNVLGISNKIDPDFFTVNLKNGDIIIMCSDGLNSMLRDDLIFKITNKNNEIKQIVEKLIYCAKAKGGLDNITIILIKI